MQGDNSISNPEIENREPENREPVSPPSRWERFVWPKWLPIRARLPLIAQITGAFALIAAVTMPSWHVSEPLGANIGPPANETPAAHAAPETPASSVAPAAPAEAPRPAHLNLDLRHNFRSVDLTVTVDNKRALSTKLEGAGKKFGVFGRRENRSFTRTLDLQPGARVVRLNVKSTDETFEHTRTERFDLGPASVATMRIDIEKSGLSVIAERPPVPQAAPAPVVETAQVRPTRQAIQAADVAAQAAQDAQEASSLATLYQSLRSVLIALAGFIASVASAFVFEEYLKSRNLISFKETRQRQHAERSERRRRLRRQRNESDIGIDAGLS